MDTVVNNFNRYNAAQHCKHKLSSQLTFINHQSYETSPLSNIASQPNSNTMKYICLLIPGMQTDYRKKIKTKKTEINYKS